MNFHPESRKASVRLALLLTLGAAPLELLP
jgi:hypothetical protein